LPDFPDRLPETLEQAYAIQTASIERWPDEVAGWKVAMLPVADRERFPSERLAGPVFRSLIHTVEAGSRKVLPVYERGFAAIEAEFVLELGVTVRPTGRDYSDEELAEIVTAVYCGAELASSPMAVVNQRGATSIISDFGNNAGVLVGPSIPDWRSRTLDSLPVTVTVDDSLVGSATAAAIPGGLLQALRFLVDHCATRGAELPAGTLVSSGAVTGVHDVQMQSIARIDYGSFGWFEVAFEPKTPRQ
jgi:2-keto-4-pentenoate hydratase